MIRYYFVRITDTIDLESCETTDDIATIEARGFVGCDYTAFRAAWREKDRKRRLELAREDARAGARQEHTPLVEPGPAMERGKVYPSSFKH